MIHIRVYTGTDFRVFMKALVSVLYSRAERTCFSYEWLHQSSLWFTIHQTTRASEPPGNAWVSSTNRGICMSWWEDTVDGTFESDCPSNTLEKNRDSRERLRNQLCHRGLGRPNGVYVLRVLVLGCTQNCSMLKREKNITLEAERRWLPYADPAFASLRPVTGTQPAQCCGNREPALSTQPVARPTTGFGTVMTEVEDARRWGAVLARYDDDGVFSAIKRVHGVPAEVNEIHVRVRTALLDRRVDWQDEKPYANPVFRDRKSERPLFELGSFQIKLKRSYVELWDSNTGVFLEEQVHVRCAIVHDA